jgi:hypothetical protein
MTGIGATDSANELHIGNRQTATGGRYYGGDACGFFKGNFSFTTTEIALLARGLTPMHLGYRPQMYFPMHAATATTVDIIGGHVATDESAATTSEGPPIRHIGG